MAEDRSDRLALPLLHAGQAQKEIIHNEALTLIDMLVQASVQSADLTAPPMTPEPGQCWIVADGATGAWAGREGALAGWTGAGWRFAPPMPGARVWVEDRNHAVNHDGAVWKDETSRFDGVYINHLRVVSERQAAIASPSGGATSDAEGRTAINAILNALRAHGLIATV
jgi:hypothetical protein